MKLTKRIREIFLLPSGCLWPKFISCRCRLNSLLNFLPQTMQLNCVFSSFSFLFLFFFFSIAETTNNEKYITKQFDIGRTKLYWIDFWIYAPLVETVICISHAFASEISKSLPCAVLMWILKLYGVVHVTWHSVHWYTCCCFLCCLDLCSAKDSPETNLLWHFLHMNYRKCKWN